MQAASRFLLSPSRQGFDITSRRNRVVKELFRLRRKRRRRLEEGLVLVRGRRPIQEIGKYFRFEGIYTHEIRTTWGSYNAEKIVRMEKDLLEQILFDQSQRNQASRLDDDEFVLGTIERPKPTAKFESPIRVLALDGVRKSENMALLVAVAVALKYNCLFFLNNCVDPFSYKVLETSQAVAWTMPYRHGTPADLFAFCKEYSLALCAADVEGIPLGEFPLKVRDEYPGFCVVLGSEVHGIDELILKKSHAVGLPMSDLMNSLNSAVAGGVLMHALTCVWAI